MAVGVGVSSGGDCGQGRFTLNHWSGELRCGRGWVLVANLEAPHKTFAVVSPHVDGVEAQIIEAIGQEPVSKMCNALSRTTL